MLYIMKGLPGSGKSRKSRQMVEADPGNVMRVNMDDIRSSMFPGVPFSNDREVKVASIRDALISHGLAYGLDVISDDTNLNNKTFTRVQALAQKFNHSVEVIDLTDVSLHDCIVNNRGPHRQPVPDSVIYNMWYKNLSPFARNENDAYTDNDFTVTVSKCGGEWIWEITCLPDSTFDVESPLGYEFHQDACVSAWLRYEDLTCALEREHKSFVSEVLAD